MGEIGWILDWSRLDYAFFDIRLLRSDRHCHFSTVPGWRSMIIRKALPVHPSVWRHRCRHERGGWVAFREPPAEQVETFPRKHSGPIIFITTCNGIPWENPWFPRVFPWIWGFPMVFSMVFSSIFSETKAILPAGRDGIVQVNSQRLGPQHLESDHLCQTVNKNHGKKGGLTMIYHDWPWFTMIYHDLP